MICIRRVRRDGSVRVLGNVYLPGMPEHDGSDPVQNLPKPGDWVKMFVYRYGDGHEERFIGEIDSPPDPDNYLRRSFWCLKKDRKKP